MISRRLHSIWDPCLVLRPGTLLRACLRKLTPRSSRAVVHAAWGDAFIVDPRRFIGAHLYMRGAHELPVCEVLHRLAGDGECAIDIGANVGVMTSILSRRVGPGGHVLGVEAHPGMVAELRQNLALWSRPNVEVIHAAVSDMAGERLLIEPATFAENEGTARLSSAPGANHGNGTHTVRAMLLDELIGDRPVGVLKVDVEGHEAEVFAGAQRTLAARRIRDIVFESSARYPAPAHVLLLSAGFSIFRIESRMRGPVLAAVGHRSAGEFHQDYLATLEPDRARQRMAPAGWNVLRRAPSSPATSRAAAAASRHPDHASA